MNRLFKDARLVPTLFAVALVLRLLACNGSVKTGAGGDGGQGGSGGGSGGGLPDPPKQSCKVASDCMWPSSVCADTHTELDYVMPSCGNDGACHWVKQTQACFGGDCAGGYCPVTVNTAAGAM